MIFFIEKMDFQWIRFTTVIWFLALLDQNSGCSESRNDWIEYIDYDFWILISVMERLKVFDDLEKLFCIACKVIFLALG